MHSDLAAPLPAEPTVEDPETPVAGSTGVAAGAILLRLGASRYAVDMADVAEVLPMPRITRVPAAPGWLRGVANWRGRMLPVVDLRPLLATPVVALSSSARILVIGRDDVVVGLITEAIPGVYDAVLTDCAPPPPTLTGAAANLIVGQVADRHGPLAVLDVGALLALRDRLERRRSGA